MNKALFLDRDGTIVKEVEGNSPETLGYLLTVEDVELIPRSAEAIAQARKLGFKIIVITNQSAVARGWLTIEELHKINEKMYSLLLEENPDARIDAYTTLPITKMESLKNIQKNTNQGNPIPE